MYCSLIIVSSLNPYFKIHEWQAMKGFGSEWDDANGFVLFGHQIIEQ